MERIKMKASFGTSWADEVEREEQEEAQKQRIEIEAEINSSRKPNPFGAARPREVVLEEKGVDWRRLDQDLEHNDSNLRKDKKLKESILSSPPIIRRDHFPLGSICPEQNQSHPQSMSPLVPPLRYAPKNIMALMEQIRRGRKDLSAAAVENSSRGGTRAYHVKNTETKPIIPREYSDSRCQRRYVDKRFIFVDQQMHANERRQVLVDLNMERANFEKQYGNCGTERRMSFSYGNEQSGRTPSVKDCSADGYHSVTDRESSVVRGLKSVGYGVRERTNPCNMSNEGVVDLRDSIRMKRRLSATQPCSCHQRRHGKQSRK